MDTRTSCGEVSVDVRIPAEWERRTMLWMLTETVLLVSGLAVDEVIEFQLAIDEIAEALIDSAAKDSEIDYDLRLNDGRITVCVTATAANRNVIDEHGLGWHVVRTVTESSVANVGAYDPETGGYPVSVEFDLVGSNRR